MGASPLPDLSTSANCPPAQDRHRLDCLVRYLLADNQGTAAWSRALVLGLDPTAEELLIEAGIGRLKITPTETNWQPVIPTAPHAPSPPPIPAPDPLRIARAAVCQTCPRHDGHRCTVAGCGCAGQGTRGALFSKCPMGLWPTPQAAP
jgi:hypothetical protein